MIHGGGLLVLFSLKWGVGIYPGVGISTGEYGTSNLTNVSIKILIREMCVNLETTRDYMIIASTDGD